MTRVFTRNMNNGKAGVDAIVARKGNAHVAIDVMTFDCRASPDAPIHVANKVAQHLVTR